MIIFLLKFAAMFGLLWLILFASTYQKEIKEEEEAEKRKEAFANDSVVSFAYANKTRYALSAGVKLMEIQKEGQEPQQFPLAEDVLQEFSALCARLDLLRYDGIHLSGGEPPAESLSLFFSSGRSAVAESSADFSFLHPEDKKAIQEFFEVKAHE